MPAEGGPKLGESGEPPHGLTAPHHGQDLPMTSSTGSPRKWNGQVLDVDLPALRAEVHASREYVLNATAR
ncbi:hypothetical protein GCM10010289_29610 [Streptomyces violascens]|uniref:Uncharacterized protein n=1 Tax=Streptomyces violascens TaxID=67381 RepID=A0ABQ3QU72_9ACTN|nr:hypothetical protein GCM10010289_29610 [Streptomyces violascens]GHI40837.1 hypothetical protein Sviol_52450 [Streptomyces violascens]